MHHKKNKITVVMLQLTIIQCERTERICLTITARLVKSFPVMDPQYQRKHCGPKMFVPEQSGGD